MFRLPAPLFLAFALAAASMVSAHHGPEKVIDDLSKRMETSGKTPVLLYRRATEYRILRAHEKAIADLLEAIKLHPEFADAWEMLAEVRMGQRKLGKAEAAARKGIEVASGRERASGHMMLARILRAAGRSEEALEACRAAFGDFPPRDIDWYLIRGALQRKLGRHAERIEGFQGGFELTGSTVLRIAALEAKIEAGRAKEVLPEIERQLASSRLKSSWLLRRARALLALGRTADARANLEAAIKELNTRIRPERPDVSLVADRGFAHALLGNKEAAKRDLALARDHGATEWVVEILIEAIGGKAPRS